MEDYDYNVLREVGRVSYEALQYTKTIVKEGRKLLEIAESAERFIKEKGFDMAFPVNLSINENAAHYTPMIDDPQVLRGDEIIKVDLGARKDSYLGDCAITIDLSQKQGLLVEASEEALETAIGMIKTGREVREIGREIARIAKVKGLNPIKNLGGHGISKEDLHAEIFIPNYDNGDNTRLEEGQVVAIEPFMTTGSGYVEDGESLQIFQKTNDAAPRSKDTREVLERITENYRTYPFAFRWLQSELRGFSEFRIRKALADLINLGALESFPVLVEKRRGMVSQAEKEVIVQKDSCEVVTKA